MNESPKIRTEKKTGIIRVINAAGYSFKGITATWRNEAAFRQECYLMLATAPALVFIDIDSQTRSLLVIVSVLVLVIELLNSAVEVVVDRIGLEDNVLSGQAKDMGSAAVLLSLMLWLYVWAEALIHA